MIRSESTVREDLIRWGAAFNPNTNRPYFEGHERADVVEHRNIFTDYFLKRKDHYYTISESTPSYWIEPIEKKTIIFFHDESTFRSGETAKKRWFFQDSAPFMNKGLYKINLT